jgi:hypothetical protein
MEEIMDAGLNVAAICLYLFHGGLWFFFTDLGEHILRGS